MDLHSKARAARARSGAKFRVGGLGSSGGRGRGGFDRKSGVIVDGKWRKHRGKGSTPGANGKMKSHIVYISREQRKGQARELCQLYDDRGKKQTALEAREVHGGCFIEHRLMVSPSNKRGKASEDDLHLLAQAVIQEVRSRNPKAEIEASYAIHRDTNSPHAHLLFSSDQAMRLDKGDYQEIKEMAQDIHREIQQMRERGLSFSNTLDLDQDNKIDHDLGLDQGMDMGV